MMTRTLRRIFAVAATLAAGASSPLAIAQPALAPPPLPAQGAVAPAPPVPGLPRPPAASGSGVRVDAAPVSRWRAAIDHLDADLRLRLLTANAPPSAWLAGELDSTDIESRVRHYAAARTAAPDDRLYQASLAAACLTRVRPPLAECEAVDRLADWARRDSDNGVPAILLADRARQRGELDSAASFIEEAATAQRFDDYWSLAPLRWWEYLRALPIDIDPAATAVAAAGYAAERDLAWASPLRALCANTAGRTDRIKAACASLGRALMSRGATFALRRAGARIAETNAGGPADTKAAALRQARLLEATARCAAARPDFASELESAAAPSRQRGIEQFVAWASAEARDGEVAACEHLAVK